MPGTYIVEADIGTVVGTKGETVIRAVVGADGKVITAFPVK